MIENSMNEQSNQTNFENNKVCNFGYLTEMMGNKKSLVKEIIDAYILQVPEELETLSAAVEKIDYPTIKRLAHTIKSSVSIMGMSTATPILQEMENLGTACSNISRINELNENLKLICQRAIEEINLEIVKYD
ncbi:MAG: Hpt domain-containing protein [Bacteroidetes bacterium]|nr:Hpt domain-containing protein [Bacteroidota bacterium]